MDSILGWLILVWGGAGLCFVAFLFHMEHKNEQEDSKFYEQQNKEK